MPQNHMWMREEMRVLGAIQIMNALIHHSLGLIWTYLFYSQIIVFGRTYIPLIAISGYPFWSSTLYIITGTFTVQTQKMKVQCLVVYTIGLNILSACISVIGLILITLELYLHSLHSKFSPWQQLTGHAKQKAEDKDSYFHVEGQTSSPMDLLIPESGNFG
ncbi:membrane-spanning 4-domains subfamily A member 12-like isoform X2 [Dipodomys merriami]